MSDGWLWVFAILGMLIFLATASVASNVTSVVDALSSKKSSDDKLGKFVELGKNGLYPSVFVNADNVTHLEVLTGEGGTAVHLIGGGQLSVYEDRKEVASRLGGKTG